MLTLDELERRLVAGLQRELPGVEAQLLLSPRPRRGWSPGEIPPDCRHSAVLLLVYPLDREPAVVLTLRHDGLPHHAGQVSLPGGALEDGESYEQAALREAQEEVGVDSSAVRLLGRLSPLHVPVSRFALHPIVALSRSRPRFRAQVGEVERIIEAPLARLVDTEVHDVETRNRGNLTYNVPILTIAGAKIWGATAMVLAEFVSLLGVVPSKWTSEH